jgi:hypothetical protein
VMVSIGYQHGVLPDLLTGMDFCAGGVEAPRLAVPAVHPGALLLTCNGTGDGGFDLFVPDTGGSGVFSLHSDGGSAVTNAKASAALLAILSAARHVYG